jgi:pathogenesis-related protein 1
MGITLLARCVVGALIALMATAPVGMAASKKAHHSPPAAAEGEPPAMAGMLAAHNRARHAVGVPDLQWSAKLAETAQGWAETLRGQHCAMRHSGAAGIGENLAWAGGRHLSPADVVAMWVREGRAFNPADNSCDRGAVCGHYTQVVWRNTKFVGCAIASCGDSEIWVCNYSPPGNYIGERPY